MYLMYGTVVNEEVKSRGVAMHVNEVQRRWVLAEMWFLIGSVSVVWI